MTRHFDYCPSASEDDNQSVRSSAPVVSRCFPGGYNVKLYISGGRLAWWLLAFLCCDNLFSVGRRVHSCVTAFIGVTNLINIMPKTDHFTHSIDYKVWAACNYRQHCFIKQWKSFFRNAPFCSKTLNPCKKCMCNCIYGRHQPHQHYAFRRVTTLHTAQITRFHQPILCL